MHIVNSKGHGMESQLSSSMTAATLVHVCENYVKPWTITNLDKCISVKM